MSGVGFEPWEPEETVGKIWHAFASRLDAPEAHEHAAATLEAAVAARLAVFFRGLGGGARVEIRPVLGGGQRSTASPAAAARRGRGARRAGLLSTAKSCACRRGSTPFPTARLERLALLLAGRLRRPCARRAIEERDPLRAGSARAGGRGGDDAPCPARMPRAWRTLHRSSGGRRAAARPKPRSLPVWEPCGRADDPHALLTGREPDEPRAAVWRSSA